MEIYNETVHDLIEGSNESLEIRQNKDGTVYVENLSKIQVSNYEKVVKLLKKASKNRATVIL